MTEPSKQWIKVRYTVVFFKGQCTVNDYRTIIYVIFVYRRILIEFKGHAITC